MTNPVELQDAWLSIGAVDKAMSVEQLARDLRIKSVLEVGCGTGAVLAEIIRRESAPNTPHASLHPSCSRTPAHAHMRLTSTCGAGRLRAARSTDVGISSSSATCSSTRTIRQHSWCKYLRQPGT